MFFFFIHIFQKEEGHLDSNISPLNYARAYSYTTKFSPDSPIDDNAVESLNLEDVTDDKTTIHITDSPSTPEKSPKTLNPPSFSPTSEEQNLEFVKKSKYRDILEVSRNLDEKYNTLILNKSLPIPSRPTDLSISSTKLDIPKQASPRTELSPSPVKLLEANFTRSPNKETPEDITGQKSPSHIYNPFPVRLSTRQNRDVGVKLGLYKK